MFTNYHFVSNKALSAFQSLFVTTIMLLALVAHGVAQSSSVTGGYTPEGLKTGRPAGSFQLSDFDNINYFNGNLNFRLPLLTVGGRGRVGYTIPLRIERKWIVYTYRNPGVVNIPYSQGWEAIETGYGPGIVIERHGAEGAIPDTCSPGQGFYQTLTRLTFMSTDGTEHELRDTATNGVKGFTHWANCEVTQTPNRGKIFISYDDSGLTFVSDHDVLDDGPTRRERASGFLLFPDGRRYRVDNGLVQWIRDSNGNKITFTYDQDKVTTATDSLNRRITFTYAVIQGNRDYDVISYQGVGGAPRNITVRYKLLSQALRNGSVMTYQQLFPELNGSSGAVFDPSVPVSVELPNGRSYQFKYNVYGQLARVELPTGGAIEYDHAAGLIGGAESGSYYPNTDKQIYRRVIERRVYPEKGSSVFESRMIISRPESYNGGTTYSNLGHVDVDTRDYAGVLLSKERHYYFGSALVTGLRNYLKTKHGNNIRWLGLVV
jgi:YD repeat-containing protein